VGIDNASHGFVEVADLADEFIASQDRTGEDVVMSGEVLGAAVNDEVDAVFERALVHRGRECAVDEGKDLVFFCDRDELVEVEDVEIWIGGGFADNETGFSGDGFVESFVVAERDDSAVDSEPLDVGTAEFEGFFVRVVGDDNVISAADEGEDGGDDRAHAGAENDAVFGVFEVGEPFFCDFFRGISITAVFVTIFLAFGVGFNFAAVFEDVRAGLHDGGGDGVGVSLADFAGMNGAGGQSGFFGGMNRFFRHVVLLSLNRKRRYGNTLGGEGEQKKDALLL